MPSIYNTPGTYVEEISRLPFSVSQVATAVPGFAGYTEFDPLKPVRIASMAEYEFHFGGPAPYSTAQGRGLSVTVETVNGKTSITGSSFLGGSDLNTRKLFHSMQLFFMNGGGPCWIMSAGPYLNSPSAAGLNAALDELGTVDEVTLLAVPDLSSEGNKAFAGEVYRNGLALCQRLGDRFFIIDPHTSSNPAATSDLGDMRSETGLANLSYGAAYYPFVVTNFTFPDRFIKITTHTGAGTVDLTSYDNLEELKKDLDTDPALSVLMAELSPSLEAVIKSHALSMPPSGAVAGVYCATDRNRGVWKAPANVSLAGVKQPFFKIDSTLQGVYNQDEDNGKSVNVIRQFTGKGTLIWGARTLDGNSNEWRFIPVRRLYIVVEKTLRNALTPVMFQANDNITWLRVKGMIENYLSGLWRQGALLGATPQQAFYVNLGVGVTMTQAEADAGILNIEIGMAAVRPAEFVILRFSHQLQRI